jgi:hypothetical protein
MMEKPDWPEGYFERLRALSLELSEDFHRPEPLPESPHRDSELDAWISDMDREDRASSRAADARDADRRHAGITPGG